MDKHIFDYTCMPLPYSPILPCMRADAHYVHMLRGLLNLYTCKTCEASTVFTNFFKSPFLMREKARMASSCSLLIRIVMLYFSMVLAIRPTTTRVPVQAYMHFLSTKDCFDCK